MMLFEESLLSSVPAGTTVGSWRDPKEEWTKYLLCVGRRWVVQRIQTPSKQNGSACCSVAESYPTLCNPMDFSTPGFPVCYYLLEFPQTHVHWVDDAIQPSHPLLPPSPPPLNPSQHQGLFQWVSSSHQVAKVLELQLQHQSVQWIFRTDFL